MGQKATVLCVDDDRESLECRSLLLKEAGFEVLTAESGPEALAIFGANHVDLAVLDYAMPEMDGVVVAAKLKQVAPHLPVLMVSGQVQVPLRAMQCVDEFLHKGDKPAKFLSGVRDLLAARSPFSECGVVSSETQSTRAGKES